MEFRIPDYALSPLTEFISLPDEATARLVESLKRLAPMPKVQDVADAVSAETGIDPRKVEKILSMFAGMHLARLAAHVPLEEFVADLSTSIKSRTDPKLAPQNWDNFQRNLQSVLGAKSLAITSKAQDLVCEAEHGLHAVRIITDVRHIFEDDPKQRPEACVIVHTLNIVYHEIERMKELYIAIDNSDMEDLKLAIERAEVKERNLESISKELGINCLSTQK